MSNEPSQYLESLFEGGMASGFNPLKSMLEFGDTLPTTLPRGKFDEEERALIRMAMAEQMVKTNGRIDRDRLNAVDAWLSVAQDGLAREQIVEMVTNAAERKTRKNPLEGLFNRGENDEEAK